MKRKKYSPEFKREAIELVRRSGASCRQVALEIGVAPNLQMVIRAVEMAIWQRQGDWSVILHSDRGSQFTSTDYQRFLNRNTLVCSMSAVGHCGDNAACEGFFGQLKRERVAHQSYRTRDEARADLFDYIERFHNPRMRRRVARQDLKFSALFKPSVETG